MLAQPTFLHYVPIAFYLLAAWHIFSRIKKDAAQSDLLNALAIALWSAALALHAAAIAYSISAAGLDFSLYKAASIFGFLLAFTLLINCFYQHITALAIFILPFVAGIVLLSTFGGSPRMIASVMSLGLAIHIVCAFIAYGILGLACGHAAVIVAQRKCLHHHRLVPILNTIPSLDAMESFLINLIAVGVLFLSIALASGWFAHDDLFAQRLAHKAFFALLAWCIFITILSGRLFRNWHGKKITSMTLWGGGMLAVAYFGSKFVLEFILHR